MEGKIKGEFLPVLTCKLSKGEQVFTESGGMSWMTSGMGMETSTNGGIMKGLGRVLSGESLFMNIYTAEQDDQEINFASSFPGKILEFDLSTRRINNMPKKSFFMRTNWSRYENAF